jgi:ATP-dependent exoDNAse (exonuclease V) alpha subunit
MANYHLSIKIFSRGKSASAVAKAAYRAGEKLRDERKQETHDYSRKRGVVHTEILLPDYAPQAYADREVLWNAVEKSETAKNAQLAREVEISLPAELTMEQNIALAREFVKRHFVRAGMCADLCVHEAEKGKPHAHIMLTLRPIDEDGEWSAKSRKEYILDRRGERIKLPSGEFKTRKINAVDWNEHTKAEEWRAAWGTMQNAALELHGAAARVDHRSYKRQGVGKIPQVRMGVAATQMERRGVRTELGDRNRAIAVTNQQLGQLRARANKLKAWAYAQPIQDAPTMIEMMSGIGKGQQLKTRWKQIADLKAYAGALIFVQKYGVYDMEAFADRIIRIHQERYDLAAEIQKKERRISKLSEHLANVDAHKKHQAVYKKYRALDPKKREAYKAKHAEEIAEYEAAVKYLKANLNGRDRIPEKEWRSERESLLASRYADVDRYYNLREDIKNAENIRRGAENHMREITPERRQTRGDISL